MKFMITIRSHFGSRLPIPLPRSTSIHYEGDGRGDGQRRRDVTASAAAPVHVDFLFGRCSLLFLFFGRCSDESESQRERRCTRGSADSRTLHCE